MPLLILFFFYNIKIQYSKKNGILNNCGNIIKYKKILFIIIGDVYRVRKIKSIICAYVTYYFKNNK